jgi:hypothetical protein
MWTDLSFNLLLMPTTSQVRCIERQLHLLQLPELAMLSDLYVQADAALTRAGWLPYVTLIAGVLVVYDCHQLVT